MDYAFAGKDGLHLMEQVANDVFKDATPKAERVTAGAPGLPQGAAQISLPAARGLLRPA